MSLSVFFAERAADTDPDSKPVYPPGTILIRAGGRKADIAKSLLVREAVFVREQNVPAELEHDEHDAEALHLLALDTDTGEPVGTARVLDKGNGVAKIGRVAVLPAYRGRGIGRLLMEAAHKTTGELRFTMLVLDAQVAVISFYERLGYVAEGDVFDDAGIPHRRMTRMV